MGTTKIHATATWRTAWFAIFMAGTLAIAYWITYLREQMTGGHDIFQRLFLFEDYAGAIFLAAALIASLVPAVQRFGTALADAIASAPLRTAALTFVALAMAAHFAYLGHPLSMDEYAPLFQSKAFAAGHLCGRFPPDLVDTLIPRGFQNVFFVVSRDGGCVASAYWPGFAALLTPFTFLGVPWLANPAVGACTVLVVHKLGLELLPNSRATGRAVLLTLASTAFTINAISFYSMAAHLLCNAAFLLLVLRARTGHAFAAGLLGGFAMVLHNPFPHALFALPCMVWMASRKNGMKLLAAAAIGYVIFLLVPGVAWSHFLHALKTDHLDATSLGPKVESSTSALHALWGSAGRIFRPPDAEVLFARAIGIAKLWLWASPGLIPLAIWGFWLHRHDSRALLLGAIGCTTLVGYLFYPESQGHGWGFRYFHSAWVILPMLATWAIFATSRSLDAIKVSALGGLAAGSAFAALLILTPLRSYQAHELIATQLAQLPNPPESGGVIFINTSVGSYRSDLVQNDPFLRDPVVRLVSVGAEQDAALAARHFPDLTPIEQGYFGSVWARAP